MNRSPMSVRLPREAVNAQRWPESWGMSLASLRLLLAVAWGDFPALSACLLQTGGPQALLQLVDLGLVSTSGTTDLRASDDHALLVIALTDKAEYYLQMTLGAATSLPR